MRSGTFHRPRPVLYHFALAMPPARSLIDGSRSPTENMQVSKPAASPCYSNAFQTFITLSTKNFCLMLAVHLGLNSLYFSFIRCDRRTSDDKHKKQSQNDVQCKAAKAKRVSLHKAVETTDKTRFLMKNSRIFRSCSVMQYPLSRLACMNRNSLSVGITGIIEKK